MASFGNGTKAYYDSMRSGLVPCIVTEIRNARGGIEVHARVTANRYAYPRGDRIVSSPSFMIPRSHVIRARSFSARIIGGYTWTVQP
jgi:hypothetical protein